MDGIGIAPALLNGEQHLVYIGRIKVHSNGFRIFAMGGCKSPHTRSSTTLPFIHCHNNKKALYFWCRCIMWNLCAIFIVSLLHLARHHAMVRNWNTISHSWQWNNNLIIRTFLFRFHHKNGSNDGSRWKWSIAGYIQILLESNANAKPSMFTNVLHFMPVYAN